MVLFTDSRQELLKEQAKKAIGISSMPPSLQKGTRIPQWDKLTDKGINMTNFLIIPCLY